MYRRSVCFVCKLKVFNKEPQPRVCFLFRWRKLRQSAVLSPKRRSLELKPDCLSWLKFNCRWRAASCSCHQDKLNSTSWGVSWRMLLLQLLTVGVLLVFAVHGAHCSRLCSLSLSPLAADLINVAMSACLCPSLAPSSPANPTSHNQHLHTQLALPPTSSTPPPCLCSTTSTPSKCLQPPLAAMVVAAMVVTMV